MAPTASTFRSEPPRLWRMLWRPSLGTRSGAAPWGKPGAGRLRRCSTARRTPPRWRSWFGRQAIRPTAAVPSSGRDRKRARDRAFRAHLDDMDTGIRLNPFSIGIGGKGRGPAMSELRVLALYPPAKGGREIAEYSFLSEEFRALARRGIRIFSVSPHTRTGYRRDGVSIYPIPRSGKDPVDF